MTPAAPVGLVDVQDLPKMKAVVRFPPGVPREKGAGAVNSARRPPLAFK